MSENEGLISKQIDVLDVIKTVGKKNKQFQAKLLQELELYMDKSSPEFQQMRKFILDEANGYTRNIVREIFGDVEYLIS